MKLIIFRFFEISFKKAIQKTFSNQKKQERMNCG